MSQQLHDFDFDLMAKLAEASPAEFALRREVLIREAIESFRSPENGRRLQGVIDAQRTCVPQGEAVYTALGDHVADMVLSLSKIIRRIRTADENNVQPMDFGA